MQHELQEGCVLMDIELIVIHGTNHQFFLRRQQQQQQHKNNIQGPFKKTYYGNYISYIQTIQTKNLRKSQYTLKNHSRQPPFCHLFPFSQNAQRAASEGLGLGQTSPAGAVERLGPGAKRATMPQAAETCSLS